jgi:cytochrome P450
LEEYTTRITIDKIASELFGFEGSENAEEMQRSMNYIENLFKQGDVISFRVGVRQQEGFKM